MTRRKPLRLYISSSLESIVSMLAQEDWNEIEYVVYYLSQFIHRC